MVTDILFITGYGAQELVRKWRGGEQILLLTFRAQFQQICGDGTELVLGGRAQWSFERDDFWKWLKNRLS